MLGSTWVKKGRQLALSLAAGCVSLVGVVGMAGESIAAERVIVSLGLLEFSLAVETLETFARTGEIQDELSAYAGYVSDEQLAQFREALLTEADLSPVAISQALYSPQGEILLERVGDLVQTGARQPGFYALRAALILASADEQGLTLLNVIKKFPTREVRIDSSRTLGIVEQISEVVEETEEVTMAAIEQSLLAAANATAATPRNLQTPGGVAYTRENLTIQDIERDRLLPITLYLPQLRFGEQAPLVVISHGLGSDRNTFTYLARHLASYGFAVAAIEHPGSNAEQLQQLLGGLRQEVTPPEELVDRPLDIRVLLDVLEDEYGSRIEVRDVGVFGQSFGGYTALALAGAPLNFERLLDECGNLGEVLNLSLILQCQALRLPEEDYNLEDDRIGAVLAINPLTSRIFGEAGIGQIEEPVMLIAGSDDTVTPALAEQIRPFTWLEVAQRYLVLIEGGTHFSVLAEETEEGVPIPETAIGPTPEVAQDYVQALATAFFKTYVAEESEYRVYLTPSYARAISRDSLPLYLLEMLSLAEEDIPRRRRRRRS